MRAVAELLLAWLRVRGGGARALLRRFLRPAGELESMAASLTLELDRPHAVYESGSKLRGVLRLDLRQELTITGVDLKLYGGAFVKWSELENTADGRAEVERSANEIYFNDVFALWGHVSAPSPEFLPIGRHSFPFCVALQPEAPCSFEGSRGWVRYHVEGVVRRPPHQDDLATRTCFTVLRDLDLEKDKVSPERLREQMTCSPVRASCCGTSHVSCALTVPRSRVVPGERVHAEVDIANISPRKIKSACIVLQQIVTYGPQGSSGGPRSRQETVELCRVSGDAIRPGRKHCWTCRTLVVPPVPPSGLQGCKFINIEYQLALHLQTTRAPSIVTVPIIVGTVPLANSPFASWHYQAQHIPAWPKSQPSLTPPLDSPEAHFLPPEPPDFRPFFKVYTPQSPLVATRKLEYSPAQRRKRRLLLADITTHESMV